MRKALHIHSVCDVKQPIQPIQLNSRFSLISVHPNPVCFGNKAVGSEARFEETEDQLSPRHFENTGSTSFLYA